MKKYLLVFSLYFVGLVESKASDTLTRSQVYNFNVGDTFDYESSSSGWPGASTTYTRKIVAGKTYSLNSDTLYIAFQTVYPVFRYDTLILSDLSNFEIYLLPVACPYIYNIDSSSSYNGRVVNGACLTSCFERNSIDSFADGLGLVFHSSIFFMDPPGVFITFVEKLIYYSKGTESWGLPYTAFTDIGDVALKYLKLSPNPCSDFLTIQLQPNRSQQATFNLFDTAGRLILQRQPLDEMNQIDLSSVSKGIYQYLILSSGSVLSAGKLAVQ